MASARIDRSLLMKARMGARVSPSASNRLQHSVTSSSRRLPRPLVDSGGSGSGSPSTHRTSERRHSASRVSIHRRASRTSTGWVSCV
jgi:hypothetical protein